MREKATEGKNKEEVKMRIPVWIYPSTLDKIDEAVRHYDFKSRSEFMEEACKFFAGYLSSNAAQSYLPEVLVEALRGTLKGSENRTARLLFKLSVEVSMMMNIIAAGMEIQQDNLNALRARCVRDVKKSNGSISFDDAIELQRGNGE